jgi:HlyD family secretion protein
MPSAVGSGWRVFRYRAGAVRVVPWAVGGAVVLGVGAGSALWLGSASAAPQTALVQVGTVSEGVYASGTLATTTTTNLGFQNGGQLAALYANVGDTVRRGQLLAREDTFDVDQALSQAQVQLATNQAQLRQVLGDVTISQSKQILARDRGIRNTDRRIVDVSQAVADKAVRTAQNNLATDEACQEGTLGGTTAGGTTAGGTTAGGTTTGTTTGTTSSTTSSSTQGGGLADALGGTVSSNVASDCSSVNNQTIKTDRLAVYSAQANARLVYLGGQRTLRNDGVTISYDEAAVNVELANRPAAIQNARGAVANQEAAVAKAQRGVDDATLRAPVDGQITSIIGTPGENVSGGVPASPLSPGNRSQLPGVGRDANYPGAAFMVLKPAHAFQMVVAVDQNGVSEIKPDEQVNLHPDGIPDLHMRGSVLSVAPAGVNMSGPSYYATVVLNGNDPRLRDGMTTKAAIITGTVPNVLVVPTAAVIKQGTATFVDVVGPDGKTVHTPFSAGVSGFDNTQVLAGLQVGQQVVLPPSGH